MPETISTDPSFIASLPGAVLVLCSVVLLALWVFTHRGKRYRRRSGVLLSSCRVLVGGLAIWFVFHLLSLVLTLATPWPWWVLAVMGGSLIEGVLFLYQLEHKVAGSKISTAITALRVGAMSLVLLILAEPVLERYINRALDRVVVLLVDESESMELSDPQRDTAEWIELGIFEGILSAKDFETEGEMSKQGAQEKSVEDFFALLPPETQSALTEIKEIKRSGLASKATFGNDRQAGLVEILNKNYDLRLVRFASSTDPLVLEERLTDDEAGGVELVAEDSSVPGDDWSRMTQLTGALEYPLENIPPDQLAGVVILSDHRDTARGHPESPAYQLSSRSVPVFPILLGSKQARHDLAVTAVDAPESIFKGERLSVDVNLKLYGVAGEEVLVQFMRGETELDRKLIQVPDDQDQFRKLIAFRDEPETDGILAYSVRVQEMEDEVILENNRWDFQTAVSEDRTNVLLVDARPRWEFRYLRNLFYGRDKSVHLQYVLTDPDTIAVSDKMEAVKRPRVMASASREFGDAEATVLPDTRDEWRKFDVIILGDVSPDFLTPKQLGDIEYCVRERGAALIVISGSLNMPHKFDDENLEKLLPVRYAQSAGSKFMSPELAYQIVPTLEGRRHPIMQLGSSVSESDHVWENQPLLKWRYNTTGVKPGATILAFAQPPEIQQSEFVTADDNPAETAARIRQMNAMREKNNLIVTQSYGLGKVMMLNYDRTWRLRYRVGDTLHHRFWGRVMTWGAGENLRAGNEFIRLGTDAITYTPEEKVKVTARVLQSDYRPVTEESFDVEVFHDGEKISTHTLQYRPESQGMYDVEIGPFEKSGTYPIRLVSSKKSKVKLDGAEVIETEFRVATALNPVEWTEFSADVDSAERIAKAGKGELISLTELDKLENAFGQGSNDELERADITLWDHWLLFVLLISMITAEWILRRNGGLL